eukprot:gb/GECG01011912.1/.p1 GENE.gb/GECG01011912.1/~~gb/GECG01011912.1/.p1  ORF type:complete len:610 (+),score=129.87 gb/GECG01011912.1/:1-1830(+)
MALKRKVRQLPFQINVKIVNLDELQLYRDSNSRSRSNNRIPLTELLKPEQKKESLQRQRQRESKAWEARRAKRAHAKHLQKVPSESNVNDNSPSYGEGQGNNNEFIVQRPPGLPPKNPTPKPTRDDVSEKGKGDEQPERARKSYSSDSGEDGHPSSSRSQPDRAKDRVRVVDEEQHRRLFGRSNSAENRQAAQGRQSDSGSEASKPECENLSARERVLAAKEARQRERQAQHEELLRYAREAQKKDKSFAQAKRREQYSGVGAAISGGLPIHQHVVSSALNERDTENKRGPQEDSAGERTDRYVLPAARYDERQEDENESKHFEDEEDESSNRDGEVEAIFYNNYESEENDQDTPSDLDVEDFDDNDESDDEKLKIPKAESKSEADEGLQNVEAGLIQELQRSTLRCQELQANIQSAKSQLVEQRSKESPNRPAKDHTSENGSAQRQPVAVTFNHQEGVGGNISAQSYDEVLVESDTETASDSSECFELDNPKASPYHGVSASVGVDMVFGEDHVAADGLAHPGIDANQHVATGSLKQRADSLRDACIQDLGQELYSELHAFLKEVMWDNTSAAYSEEFLQKKQQYLEEHPRTHNLLTQLLHIEEAVGI